MMKKSIVIGLVLVGCLFWNAHAEISTAEREALTELYNSTNGEYWTDNTGWLGGIECQWFGIFCNPENNNMTGLNLPENNLIGVIPESLGNLSNLESLQLGNFPDDLVDPMPENQLTGTIPESLGNLSNLKHLNLWGNALTGTIPESLGNLTNLMMLDSGRNQLIGQIPSSLGNLKELNILYLNDNQLAGYIPTELINLTKLQSVDLCNNYLYASDPGLCKFLNDRQYGGDWQSCQGIPPDRVKISGTVTSEDGTPLCAMVLANGQYMFSCEGSCAGDEGNYNLYVPLNDKGEIDIFSFVDGFSPFEETIPDKELGSETTLDIKMKISLSDPAMTITKTVTPLENSNWVKISGEVSADDGTPLCTMILANGEHIFSCGEPAGSYELEVPLSEEGEITLHGFCDGFLPFKETFTP